jgi:hypothetical protein
MLPCYLIVLLGLIDAALITACSVACAGFLTAD